MHLSEHCKEITKYSYVDSLEFWWNNQIKVDCSRSTIMIMYTSMGFCTGSKFNIIFPIQPDQEKGEQMAYNLNRRRKEKGERRRDGIHPKQGASWVRRRAPTIGGRRARSRAKGQQCARLWHRRSALC